MEHFVPCHIDLQSLQTIHHFPCVPQIDVDLAISVSVKMFFMVDADSQVSGSFLLKGFPCLIQIFTRWRFAIW
jgi:hypothetical protein